MEHIAYVLHATLAASLLLGTINYRFLFCNILNDYGRDYLRLSGYLRECLSPHVPQIR